MSRHADPSPPPVTRKGRVPTSGDGGAEGNGSDSGTGTDGYESTAGHICTMAVPVQTSSWMKAGGFAVLNEDVETNAGRKLPMHAVFSVQSVDHEVGMAVLKAATFPAWPRKAKQAHGDSDDDDDGGSSSSDDNSGMPQGLLQKGFRFKRLHRLSALRGDNGVAVAQLQAEAAAARRASRAFASAVPASPLASRQTPTTLRRCISYDTIVMCMRKLALPREVGELIGSYLTVQPVRYADLSVVGSSSDRGDFPLDTVLKAKVGTWWISAEGSMPNGRGEQYLEFQMDTHERIRRVRFVGVSIPPLPYGPLSVRNFRIDYKGHDAGGAWVRGPEFETMDAAGVQVFELPDAIDAMRVRFVALMNASAAEFPTRRVPYDCIGLYHIRFQ